MSFEVKTKFDGKLIVIEADRASLAKIFVRFQEHYESPYKTIRGKVFTLGYLRSLYPVWDYLGGNHFDPRWAGYNFPDYVLKPFIEGLFDPMTPQEQDLVNLVRHRRGSYYIIGVSEDDAMTIDHEVCHAMYYLIPAYKKEVLKELKKYDLKGLKQAIIAMGYSEAVVDDECHAYMSANYDEWFGVGQTVEYLALTKKYNISVPKALHESLRIIKDRYNIEK